MVYSSTHRGTALTGACWLRVGPGTHPPRSHVPQVIIRRTSAGSHGRGPTSSNWECTLGLVWCGLRGPIVVKVWPGAGGHAIGGECQEPLCCMEWPSCDIPKIYNKNMIISHTKTGLQIFKNIYHYYRLRTWTIRIAITICATWILVTILSTYFST